MTFAHAVTLRDNHAVSTLHGTTHVGLQFRAVHLTILMNGINLAVIIEEHTEVIDITLHIMVRPGTADILCRVALQPLAVDVREHIELSVGITDSGCPDTLTVNLLMILQRELIIGEVKTVEAVAHVLPVHQVLGVQDNQSRHRMHRGACQVIVITHTDDIRVRKLIIKQRIRKCAVAIIGCPRLLGIRIQSHASHQANAP